MKFVLKYNKGKTIDIKNADGTTSKMDRSSFVLVWQDNDGERITSWSWSGNNSQYAMTRKLQQIKTSIPDMILEHEVGA